MTLANRIARLESKLIAFQAHAAITGNRLAESCRNADQNLEWGFCVGFVLGVLGTTNDLSSVSKREICVPPEAVQSQVARVVAKWLDDNPEKLHFSASSLVRAALAQGFPCKK